MTKNGLVRMERPLGQNVKVDWTLFVNKIRTADAEPARLRIGLSGWGSCWPVNGRRKSNITGRAPRGASCAHTFVSLPMFWVAHVSAQRRA